jgi:hypothetical protein
MRQAPRSPLSFKLQRVANVPERPPPSTRLMSCAHIANRRLSRIIGASSVVFCISYDTLPLIEGRTMKRAAPHDFYSCIHSSGAETCNRKCDTHLTNAYPTTYPFVLATV